MWAGMPVTAEAPQGAGVSVWVAIVQAERRDATPAASASRSAPAALRPIAARTWAGGEDHAALDLAWAGKSRALEARRAVLAWSSHPPTPLPARPYQVA